MISTINKTYIEKDKKRYMYAHIKIDLDTINDIKVFHGETGIKDTVYEIFKEIINTEE